MRLSAVFCLPHEVDREVSVEISTVSPSPEMKEVNKLLEDHEFNTGYKTFKILIDHIGFKRACNAIKQYAKKYIMPKDKEQ